MIKRLLLPLVAAALLGGCATYTVSHQGGRHLVQIENDGWFFLNLLPIACGDADRPNLNECRWFTNTVTLDNNMKILKRAMVDDRAYRVKSLFSHYSDEGIFFILLKRRIYHTSAELITE